MTYNVFSGMLNPTQSINLDLLLRPPQNSSQIYTCGRNVVNLLTGASC